MSSEETRMDSTDRNAALARYADPNLPSDPHRAMLMLRPGGVFAEVCPTAAADLLVELDQLRAQRDALSGMLRGMARKARRYDQIGDRIARMADEEIAVFCAQRAAVLALHQAEERAFANGDTREMCIECDAHWPCPTVQALGVEA